MLIYGPLIIFNGLVQMNDSLEVKPCIAKSWYISDDERTYVFNLRDDVYFHKHKLFGDQKTRTRYGRRLCF